MIQIESAEGVRNLDSILTECPDIDIVWFGTLDARVSMNLEAKWGGIGATEPEWLEISRLFFNTIDKHDKPYAGFAFGSAPLGSPEKLKAAGERTSLIMVAADVSIDNRAVAEYLTYSAADHPTVRDKILKIFDFKNHFNRYQYLNAAQTSTMVRLFTAIIIGSQLLGHVIGHALPQFQPRSTNGTIQYPYPELGTDDPADYATTGYFINHLCINVKNLTASVDFYSNVFGLRKIFTLHVTEHYSITYMGHSHGGKNGTGYQTTLELNREKNNAEGLIELIYVDVPVNNIEAGIERPNTFAHIGMVVPDIKAMQSRLDDLPDVNVMKKYGESLPMGGKVSGATGLPAEVLDQLSSAEKKQIEAALAPNTEPLIFVADPDGNLIEIQPQEGAALA
ncbi:Lactoylglutathione lyase [Colletotrichum sp. SAR 10_96]|nr:Lactoylglutathione lyase [Colletotrichum sp. SAR 10_96]